MRRRAWLSGVLLVVTPAAAQAATICETNWRDAARNREIPVRIRMPDGNGRVPAILFSHGLGGSLDGGTAWGEAWADAGLAVIHLQHPGSDRAVFRSRGMDGPRGAVSGGQLMARARDVSFVIDQLASVRRVGACDLSRIDRARIGMSGHSFGSQTTMAVSGQSYGARGPALRDPRIVAAIAFSPAPPSGADQPAIDRAFGSVSLPMMMLTGTRDGGQLGRALSPADRQKPFGAIASRLKYLLVFEGADHMNFGGNLRRPPSSVDVHVTTVTRAATTAFWRAILLRDRSARAALAPGGAVERSLAPGDRITRGRTE